MDEAKLRTAARRQGDKIFINPDDTDNQVTRNIARGGRIGFEVGAVWLAENLPTKDDIAKVTETHYQCLDWGAEDYENACWCGWDGDETETFEQHLAEVIFTLIEEKLT